MVSGIPWGPWEAPRGRGRAPVLLFGGNFRGETVRWGCRSEELGCVARAAGADLVVLEAGTLRARRWRGGVSRRLRPWRVLGHPLAGHSWGLPPACVRLLVCMSELRLLIRTPVRLGYGPPESLVPRDHLCRRRLQTRSHSGPLEFGASACEFWALRGASSSTSQPARPACPPRPAPPPPSPQSRGAGPPPPARSTADAWGGASSLRASCAS